MSDPAKFIPPGAGPVHDVLGIDLVTYKIVGADTGGQYAVFETITRPGAGTPPHVHHREEETFYVLEGEYEFHVGDETIRATPGAMLVGRRDVPHWFRNIGPGPAKVLVIVHPAGIEHFFAELAALPKTSPLDIPAAIAIAQRYGIEFLLG